MALSLSVSLLLVTLHFVFCTAAQAMSSPLNAADVEPMRPNHLIVSRCNDAKCSQHCTTERVVFDAVATSNGNCLTYTEAGTSSAFFHNPMNDTFLILDFNTIECKGESTHFIEAKNGECQRGDRGDGTATHDVTSKSSYISYGRGTPSSDGPLPISPYDVDNYTCVANTQCANCTLLMPHFEKVSGNCATVKSVGGGSIAYFLYAGTMNLIQAHFASNDCSGVPSGTTITESDSCSYGYTPTIVRANTSSLPPPTPTPYPHVFPANPYSLRTFTCADWRCSTNCTMNPPNPNLHAAPSSPNGQMPNCATVVNDGGVQSVAYFIDDDLGTFILKQYGTTDCSGESMTIYVFTNRCMMNPSGRGGSSLLHVLGPSTQPEHPNTVAPFPPVTYGPETSNNHSNRHHGVVLLCVSITVVVLSLVLGGVVIVAYRRRRAHNKSTAEEVAPLVDNGVIAERATAQPV